MFVFSFLETLRTLASLSKALLINRFSFSESSRVTEGPSLDEIVLETDTTDFDAFLKS